MVDDCVCDRDPSCCDPAGGWDLLCVALAVSECGARCPPLFGDCCEAGPQIGCDSDEVVACVCASASDCCSDEWASKPCEALADSCLPLGC